MGLFKKPDDEDFAAERKRRFKLACEAYRLAPFHKDKKTYAAMAWAEVDAYLDWVDLQSL